MGEITRWASVPLDPRAAANGFCEGEQASEERGTNNPLNGRVSNGFDEPPRRGHRQGHRRENSSFGSMALSDPELARALGLDDTPPSSPRIYAQQNGDRHDPLRHVLQQETDKSRPPFQRNHTTGCNLESPSRPPRTHQRTVTSSHLSPSGASVNQGAESPEEAEGKKVFGVDSELFEAFFASLGDPYRPEDS